MGLQGVGVVWYSYTSIKFAKQPILLGLCIRRFIFPASRSVLLGMERTVIFGMLGGECVGSERQEAESEEEIWEWPESQGDESGEDCALRVCGGYCDLCHGDYGWLG